MSRGVTVGIAREAACALGYHVISKEQELRSFVAALCRRYTQLIGLDSANPRARLYRLRAGQQREGLVAYLSARRNWLNRS